MKSVKPFVPKAEVARRRGVSRPTVYEMIRKGLLPIDKYGRIPRDAFEQMEARLSSQEKP
jgi:excisionase family DNA binding protein